jgi:ShK domain-like.
MRFYLRINKLLVLILLGGRGGFQHSSSCFLLIISTAVTTLAQEQEQQCLSSSSSSSSSSSRTATANFQECKAPPFVDHEEDQQQQQQQDYAEAPDEDDDLTKNKMKNSSSSSSSSSCRQRVQSGECNSNQSFMFLHCPMDCLKDDLQLGAILHYNSYSLNKKNINESSSSTFDQQQQQVVTDSNIHSEDSSLSLPSPCQDLRLDCYEIAEEGECRINDTFRIETCPKTCRHCFQQG